MTRTSPPMPYLSPQSPLIKVPHHYMRLEMSDPANYQAQEENWTEDAEDPDDIDFEFSEI